MPDRNRCDWKGFRSTRHRPRCFTKPPAMRHVTTRAHHGQGRDLLVPTPQPERHQTTVMTAAPRSDAHRPPAREPKPCRENHVCSIWRHVGERFSTCPPPAQCLSKATSPCRSEPCQNALATKALRSAEPWRPASRIRTGRALTAPIPATTAGTHAAEHQGSPGPHDGTQMNRTTQVCGLGCIR